MAEKQNDLTRTILGALFIVGLIGVSLWILLPFLAAIIWAATIVAATWSLMTKIQSWLWGRRWAAVTVMTLILLCVLVAPLSAAIGVIVSNADTIIGWAKSLTRYEITLAPEWVIRLPLVGGPAAEAWNKLAASGLRGIAVKAWPYAGSVIQWLLSHVGSVGVLFVQFLLTVILSALLYANGERAADGILRFGQRLAGRRGEDSVRLAGQAIRGIALGVVVTALAQSVLGGIGLFITGVPFAPILTAVMFILAIAQIGPIPVLGASVVWLYWSSNPVGGTVLLLFTLVVGTMDNFLRPYLIKKGADLPLLLIFAGVIGGLMAFGIIGIFIGPVVLAVAYTLTVAWVAGEPEEAEGVLEAEVKENI
jgi:predicted PurR-regulated permease PerM